MHTVVNYMKSVVKNIYIEEKLMAILQCSTERSCYPSGRGGELDPRPGCNVGMSAAAQAALLHRLTLSKSVAADNFGR
jgi:hypothetical protein